MSQNGGSNKCEEMDEQLGEEWMDISNLFIELLNNSTQISNS